LCESFAVRRLLRWSLVGISLALATVLAGVFFGGVDLFGARWPVKTFRDRDRALVRRTPVDATVSSLEGLPRPPDSEIHGRRRVPPHELTVYRVRARLRRVIGSGDGDIHLLLADLDDPRSTLIVEIPHPLLAVGSGLEEVFRAERLKVSGRRAGGIVVVTGVGFFDRPGRGKSPNAFELHPVLTLEFQADGGPR
jgi:hypothetical protein